MKVLLTVLVFFLCINIGLIYYILFFGDISHVGRQIDVIEQKLAHIKLPEASADSDDFQASQSASPSFADQQLIINQITRAVKREIAEESLDSDKKETDSETETPATPISPVYYLPLGDAQSKSDSGQWKDTNLEIDLNSASFGTNVRLRFEATLKIPTENGQVKARLYNVNVGAVSGTEITGEGSSGQYVKSQYFTIDPGDKTIRLQMLTTLNYDALIENARLRVELIP
jgi:hypothetical protein